MGIPKKAILRKVLTSQTCDATAGTKSTHEHGLGYAPNAQDCIPVPTAGDNNNDAVNGSVCVVKTDDTYVYVKSNVNSQTFNMHILLDADIGNQRNN